MLYKFIEILISSIVLIPVFVLLVSAALMLVCGLFIKVFKMKWLETYSLAISMVGAMIFAVLIAPLFQ